MKFCYFASSHWDREWYRPFQYFRGMLLEQAEKILDTLENDPAYERFVFDGQSAECAGAFEDRAVVSDAR